MSDKPPRIQFVISGKFIALLLISVALLVGGYYWYGRQVKAQQHVIQVQERFKTPPYFVNGGRSVVRSCYQCLFDGKLKAQSQWKVSAPKEIPETEVRWFLAVEDPPVPVTVSGVLMLPVFPALHENPALGFSQTRVELVLFQNLQRKGAIEQPTPPPAPMAAPAQAAPAMDSTTPVTSNPDGKQ